MIFIETSVLVASWQQFHADHEACFALVASLSPRDACTSAHCVTEVFSVMTRLPLRYRISPLAGFRLVEQTRDLIQIADLEPAETVRAIEDFATRGLDGGMIYDALIVACARKMRAATVYTLNKRHFDLVAPDLAAIIRRP